MHAASTMIKTTYPLPPNEAVRLKKLDALGIVGTPREKKFNAVVELARTMFGAPVGLLSFISKDEQWLKAAVGLDVETTPRDVAFCNYTIAGNGPFVVHDALSDSRFSSNPLVVGDPNIRFYAGVPVGIEHGINLGALCVIDSKPRSITRTQSDQLVWLGTIVNSLLRKHDGNLKNRRLVADLSRTASLLAEQTNDLLRQKRLLDAGRGSPRPVHLKSISRTAMFAGATACTLFTK